MVLNKKEVILKNMTKIRKLLIINGLVCLVFLALFLPNTTKVSAAYCAPYVTKQCISNIVYWYNSCGVLQDIYQNCNTTNQICQNGQCVQKAPSFTPTPAPIYTPNPTPKPTPILTITSNQNQNAHLGVSIFGQKESDNSQLGKNISATNNDKINFLLVIKNSSSLQIDNVSVRTDITDNMAYTDNLQIDNLPSAGNIVSGIDLGTIPANTSRMITFTGSVLPQTNKNPLQIVANISAGNIVYDSDYLMININAQATPNNIATSNIATAAISTPTDNSFTANFKKNWYIWIAVVIVLIFIFIIIFRRLSSNV